MTYKPLSPRPVNVRLVSWYPIGDDGNAVYVVMWNGDRDILQRGEKLFIPIPGVTL